MSKNRYNSIKIMIEIDHLTILNLDKEEDKEKRKRSKDATQKDSGNEKEEPKMATNQENTMDVRCDLEKSESTENEKYVTKI